MKPTQEQVHAASVERKRINRMYFDVLGPGGAKELIDDLERQFSLRTMVKKAPDGYIDPNATLVNCGAFEVLSWIKQCIQFGEQGK